MAKPEPRLFDEIDEAAEAEADARADADVVAGRAIGHQATKAWLLSWGTADETAAPALPS
jgi:predicted transcriptional regulator